MTYSIHETEGRNVIMLFEVAYSLTAGGGKPGQGYPCVMLVEEQDDISKSDGNIEPRRSSGKL